MTYIEDAHGKNYQWTFQDETNGIKHGKEELARMKNI
jgi:hypothetical protein